MVKLIASDLDGTLLQNGAHDVNPIVFDQIRTLKEHGIIFADCSLRFRTILHTSPKTVLSVYTTKRLFPKELLSRILLTVSWMKLQNIHNTTASSPANVSATAPRKIRNSIITW